MNDDIRKLCILLAAAGFDRYRVEELIVDLSRVTPKKIMSEFDKARRYFEDGLDVDIKSSIKKQGFDNRTHDDTTSKIVELLLKESRLTPKESFYLLEGMLRETFPNRDFPPPNSKMGIAGWIRALTKEFSDSELLHVASRLRNQIVHGIGPQNDWVLKE